VAIPVCRQAAVGSPADCPAPAAERSRAAAARLGYRCRATNPNRRRPRGPPQLPDNTSEPPDGGNAWFVGARRASWWPPPVFWSPSTRRERGSAKSGGNIPIRLKSVKPNADTSYARATGSFGDRLEETKRARGELKSEIGKRQSSRPHKAAYRPLGALARTKVISAALFAELVSVPLRSSRNSHEFRYTEAALADVHKRLAL
jgi:hypothetical protein